MFLPQAVALLALPLATLAVTLSDFRSASDNMREADLPPRCTQVYKSDIGACSPDDFTGGAGCGPPCVQALQSLVGEVQDACGNRGLKGTGVIASFLGGTGVGSICPGAPNTPPNRGASTTGTKSASSEALPTSTSTVAAHSSGLKATTTTGLSLSGTATASSLGPTATGSMILVDTSSAAAPSSTTSRHGSAGDSGDRDGHGSPFDTPASTTASTATTSSATNVVSITLTTILLSAAAMLLGTLR